MGLSQVRCGQSSKTTSNAQKIIDIWVPTATKSWEGVNDEWLLLYRSMLFNILGFNIPFFSIYVKILSEGHKITSVSPFFIENVSLRFSHLVPQNVIPKSEKYYAYNIPPHF
jgi:hypothetical protein